MNIVDSIQEYHRLRGVKEIISNEEKRNNEALKEIEAKILNEYDAQGITSMTVPGIGVVSKTTRNFASVADFEIAKEWLINQGDDWLIKETINPQSLRSYITGRKEEGSDMPPEEAIKIYSEPSLSLRKK